MLHKQIDGILIFVIGEDPAWQASFNSYMSSIDTDFEPIEVGNHRFRSLNQAYNCVWGIIKFLPWLRRLYLVSASQRLPHHEQLVELTARVSGPELVYVDHSEIFLEQSNLPTFNADPIQSNLFRIQGLAEHFIYFEDDIVVMNPVRPEDFFIQDGTTNRVAINNPKIMGTTTEPTESWESIVNNTIELLEQIGYHKPFYSLMHFPIPLSKAAFCETEKLFRADFQATAAQRIRSHEQMRPMDLVINYMLQNGTATLSNKLVNTEVCLDESDLETRLHTLLKSSYSDFLNIIDSAGVASNDSVIDTLDKFYNAYRQRKFVRLKKCLRRLLM